MIELAANDLSDDLTQLMEQAASERVGTPSAKRVTVGLVGRGIQESRSPRLHEIEGEHHGLDYRYTLFDFDRLGLPDASLRSVLESALAAGFQGLNVTHPFKEAITPLLDAVSADADAIGSVNTVVFEQGKSIGHNTDCWGFDRSFRLGLADHLTDRVLLLGAGGAGRAVGRALHDLGMRRIAIHDTERARAQRLADILNAGAGEPRAQAVTEVGAVMGEVDGVVNATPIGMAKYPGIALPPDALTSRLWVVDIVYFPERTKLVALAQKLGCPTLPGTTMAVFQAAKAFELFSGKPPDCDRMLHSYQFAAPQAI